MLLPNPLESRFGRLSTFFFLYVTEGIPVGFTATAVSTQMRRAGVGADKISLFVGTLYLPWSFKFLVGPVVDLVYSDRLGRRRAWIGAMQVLMALMLLGLMPVDFSAQLTLFTILVAVLNAFGATQDVAIDALAVGVLKEDERGLANGLMFAGAYSGQAVGGAGVLFLASFVGFSPTYLFVAGCVLMVTVFFVLPVREKPTAPLESEPGEVWHGIADKLTAHFGAGSIWHERADKLAAFFGAGSVWRRIMGEVSAYCVTALLAFFGNRASFAALGFALLPAGAYALSLALQANLAVELGLNDAQVGLLALLSTIISAVCCVVGGYLSDRFGRRVVMAICIVATTQPTLWLAWMMGRYGWVMPINMELPDRPVAPPALLVCFWAATLLYSAFQGLMYGVRTALFMDVCDPRVAATQFTAYMALLNLVIFYSGAWQALVIGRYGYPATLTLDAALGLLCLFILPFTRRGPWWR